MAYMCEICGKTKMSGKNVSHSHLRTNRVWKPNLQEKRLIIDGQKTKVKICTSCLKNLTKV